ncbi:YdcF family protein [Chitinophaga sp. 212800010-3]|uniref:YdcF family protein n=1 Tax=unclassified Chitinophaga TaxID=2619133 RepID=UPI002DE1F96B|nr:DUF218 domain-containing protein [Chitinophaga sp. 212800010-3]
MQYLKTSFITSLFLLFWGLVVFGQPAPPDPYYKFPASNNLLQDRIFYYFTLVERFPALSRLLEKEVSLQELTKEFRENALHADTAVNAANGLRFTDKMINGVDQIFRDLWQQHRREMQVFTDEMKASGLFQLYASKPGDTLLSLAWKDAANGVNYIINAYTNGTGMRYPVIDSALTSIHSPAYREKIRGLVKSTANNSKGLFFQASLQVALQLLELNHRNEAVRYEPLSATNAAAYSQVKKTDWDKYPYPAMLILGASPVSMEHISETGKSRCRTGAELYHKGLAPFIIVSGGHVRPPGTAYSEAIEMRKYLVEELKIPASAVIADPYARHTTTNIRNAVRMLFRSGFPMNKRMMCVSDAMHLVYVNSPVFAQRCMTELGYVPAADIRQGDLYFLTFMPDLRSLQVDVFDPLDP